MKKLQALAFVALVFVAFSCSKDKKSESTADLPTDSQTIQERNCASNEVYELQMATDPAFARNQEAIERFTAEYVKGAHDRSGSVKNIPVVFNVLYANAAENVSLAQLQSQIDVLNEDYGATNSDYSNIPSLFQPVASGDVGFSFTLQNVVRKATTKRSWRTNDDVKKAAKGGIDPTNPAHVLNIWVCTLANGVLGYAQFPGGPLATDGVVLLNTGTGRVGTAAAPYGLGRTATHEIGHWANLRHIWGDATCGNDQVADTPLHNASNGGCPAYPHLSTCTGTPVEMTMNYMDYTYDACMYMFSAGQKARMHAVFAPGGPRASF